MASVAIKNKEARTKNSFSKKRASRSAGKVVELFPSKASHAGSPFSQEERDNLVVTYRLKARKLARSILRKWHARLDLQEVDSVVDLSLCEAVIRFNPAKGASFMTFLFYHLRGNLIRAVSVAASLNTIPLADHELQNKNMKAEGDHRGANAIEIAEALSSQEYMLPDEVLLKKELVSISTDACAKLDPLEKEIIERIYLQEQQLMDIASSLGYSRCHISRVKKKALEALHSEITVNLGVEASRGPITDDEESEASSTYERRKIHRRRPRSKVSRGGRSLHAVPLHVAA